MMLLVCAFFSMEGKIALAANLPGWLPSPEVVEAIAQTFAKPAVDRGDAVGVGVSILIGDRPPVYFSYGLADAETKAGFDRNLFFQIGSVTKVFTTNLLGQQIYDGTLSLDKQLSDLSNEVGTFNQNLGPSITLQYLADFTSGFPDTAPVCLSYPSHRNVFGCMPNDRPSISQYDAQNFLLFLQNVPLMNYQHEDKKGKIDPITITSLPAPYEYSDFSVGLLGLILGANPNTPLNNGALTGWVNLLNQRLLLPLGMTHTFLPPIPLGGSVGCIPGGSVDCGTVGSVSGYDLATGYVDTVSPSGGLENLVVEQGGGYYNSGAFSPWVKIVGGGGSGAKVTATVSSDEHRPGGSGSVTALNIVNPGTGYIAPPRIMLSTCALDPSRVCGPQPDCSGSTTPIIAGGKVIAAMIDKPGRFPTPPLVKICGGRRNGPGDRDATATAHVANNQLTFISIDDGGTGYVDPVSVKIEPGKPTVNPVPIWAPAGALQSTLEDMSIFAAAALGRQNASLKVVTPEIAADFKIAQQPYACQVGQAEIPCLATVDSPPTQQVGLSWAIFPTLDPNSYPVIVSKNGGLDGFSTQIDLMPEEKIGVVVFVNSFDTTTKVAEAEIIARNILNALHYTINGGP